MFRVVSGDLPKTASVVILFGRGAISWISFENGILHPRQNSIDLKGAQVELVSTQETTSIGRKAGGALAGGLIAGTLGAVVGAAASGNHRPGVVRVILTLPDGRKCCLDTDQKGYNDLRAVTL